MQHTLLTALVVLVLAKFIIALFAGGEEKNTWYTLFTHGPNYSKDHVAELGALLI